MRFGLFALWASFCGLFTIVLCLSGMYLYLDPKSPDVETYRTYQLEQPLRIFSAEGALLAEFGDRRLIPVAIEDVPKLYLDAVVSTEDKRFFHHQGIDWISLANDALDLLFTDGVKRGASTITMQLPRNIADLSREQTFVRKFREMLLAIKIERELTKDEILELYINIVPFGKHSYGVQAAAYTYYGKPVHELNLAQLAMLAGLPKRPEAGNPINGPEWALDRRNLVLRRMRDTGAILQEQYEEASQTPITARVHRRELDLYAPYPAEIVRQEVIERFGHEAYSGYSVHTTIDVDHQQAAQDAVRNELEAFDRRRGYRGPERRISVSDEIEDIQVLFVRELANESEVGSMLPAIVLSVDEQSIEVVLADGQVPTVKWEGLKWARKSFGDSGVGRSPQSAYEIVEIGNLVRVRQEDGNWVLVQVPEIQGSIVAANPRTGAITAMVGGYSFGVNQYNHASQLQRQPGSGFKPFVYTAALANGVTPATVFLDAPLVYNDDLLETAYRPRNFSGTYNGPTRVREALYRSINLVSIRVLEQVGADSARDFVTRFGFAKEELPNNTQLAIGGGTITVSPLEMVAAYSVIANGGYQIEPHLIAKVVNQDGDTLYQPAIPVVCTSCGYEDTGFDHSDWSNSDSYQFEHSTQSQNINLAASQVLDERLAFLVDSMLRDVIRQGTGRGALALERNDLAGKTGTTDRAVDTWFNGFQQNLVASSWVGYTSQRALGESEFGSRSPLSIWVEFMRTALTDVPEFVPEPPNGIVSVKIDPATGHIAQSDLDSAITEYFLAESAPIADSVRTSSDTHVLSPEELF
ncbi:MAG: PBP1A family penicillin-binding protein [Gammaproteobacteria bacterium]|nr:PBP1A family penicillin-binding protein [Gammaproteobacteria bacterium]MYD79724.1 PBP1A family penicillin-binding protein [Gammaproteobacteria bacterium]